MEYNHLTLKHGQKVGRLFTLNNPDLNSGTP
jgi:hypothetical protein